MNKISPDDMTFYQAVMTEMKNRGITFLTSFSATEIRLLNQYRATGRTAAEVGAQMTMDIIRAS